MEQPSYLSRTSRPAEGRWRDGHPADSFERLRNSQSFAHVFPMSHGMSSHHSQIRYLVIGSLLVSGPIAVQDPATLEWRPAKASSVSGTTTKFRAVVRDAAGKVVDTAQVVWFAVPYDVAKADRAGTVTTFRPAQVTVFARAGRLT